MFSYKVLWIITLIILLVVYILRKSKHLIVMYRGFQWGPSIGPQIGLPVGRWRNLQSGRVVTNYERELIYPQKNIYVFEKNKKL